jgi:aldose 1-epimerase
VLILQLALSISDITFLTQKLVSSATLTMLTMLTRSVAALAVLLPMTALAQSGSAQTVVSNSSTVQPNGKYQIESEGIRANFIPYGASLTDLFITDVHGIERDIVLGFDNASYYSVDKQHPHLGGVPGQYMLFPIFSLQADI